MTTRHIHIHVYGRTRDAGTFKEADHPRADNGQFGSGGGSGAEVNRHKANAAAIKAMPQDKREDTTPWDMPGGGRAYDLYAAEKLCPKPSDKLKRVSETSSKYEASVLGQSYHYVANVDGHFFGVTKQEDPDADDDNEDDEGNMKQFVYEFVRLDHPDEDVDRTQFANNEQDLFKAMRAYKPPEGDAKRLPNSKY